MNARLERIGGWSEPVAARPAQAAGDSRPPPGTGSHKAATTNCRREPAKWFSSPAAIFCTTSRPCGTPDPLALSLGSFRRRRFTTDRGARVPDPFRHRIQGAHVDAPLDIGSG